MRAAAGLSKTKTLSVRERLSGRLFFADSGADVSVFPATASDKLASEGWCSLRAANGSGIMTYGPSSRHLDFPGIAFNHKFVLADVTRPLLGADFFDAHDLCVDFKGKRILKLVDNRVVYAIPASPPRQTRRRLHFKSSRPRVNIKSSLRSSQRSSSRSSALTAMRNALGAHPRSSRLRQSAASLSGETCLRAPSFRQVVERRNRP